MAGLNESNIKWENIKAIKIPLEKISLIEFDIEFDIEFEILEYDDILGETKKKWWKIQGSLPYNFKSSWRSTKPMDWLQYAKEKLLSNLQQKYANIKMRDYNYGKFLEKIGGIDDLSKIFNKSFDKKINDSFVGQIYYDLVIHNKPVYASKISDIPNEFEIGLTQIKFLNLMLNNCYYCGISMVQINSLRAMNLIQTKRARGYSMEIDQQDPYERYTDGNCVTSCYWCNNAKTDEFTTKKSVDEFKTCIAPGIRAVWNSRLSNADLDPILEQIEVNC